MIVGKNNFGAQFEIADNKRIITQNALVHSIWDIEVLRRKLRGSTYYWDLISQCMGNYNIVTNQGLNAILNIMFGGAGSGNTQITTWYVLIYDTDTTPAAGDTYLTRTGTGATTPWVESTKYGATRPAYVEINSTAQSTTNAASKATFTMDNTATIYGAALVGGGTDAATAGDTAGGGTLYAAARFASSQAVVSSDVVQITAILTSSDV